MKTKLVLVALFAYIQFSDSFLTVKDFKRGDLTQCYNDRVENRLSNDIVNGQELPLPSSIETFIALIERLESVYPSTPCMDIIQKLLMSFRVDEIPADFRAWGSAAKYANEFEKAFFNIPETFNYAWKEEDFSKDEKCAMHFMLSHTVNSTSQGKGNEELLEDGTSKYPRESGVVSLHGKWKHAFALGKVLLGIMAGLSGNNQMNAIDIYRKMTGKREDSLASVKVNRLYAVTIGELLSNYVNKNYKRGEGVIFLPNGVWNDPSCTTQYALKENNKKYVTNSLLRGAVDGLIIGKKLEEKPDIYQKMRLSQILRLYYGPTGLFDDLDATTTKSETQWCTRERNFESFATLRDEIFNFHKLYTNIMGDEPQETSLELISEVLSYIQKSSEIFGEVANEASSECGGSETTLDKRCTTPFDIFAILDMSVADPQRNFQIEVLGNLSVNFDVRPRGNTVGVYTNLNPTQNRGLHNIVNNTGISGCQSCFTKYYSRRSSKTSELQVFENLNETLADYAEAYDNTQSELTEVKSGAPAKVILYFSYNSAVNEDWKLRDAVWEIEKSYREATILAVGPSKDALKPFTINDDQDIFITPSSIANAADFATKIKTRICKAPAEFQFKECFRSSRNTEAENKHVGFIAVNKKQYWAMFPKYFLKSYGVTLKFKPLEGAQIKVCFSRSYYRIVEDNAQHSECYESSGDEIKFFPNNPCYRRNAQTCDPFYFSVEGKKSANAPCESIKCNTPKDIQFEFQHEGISCNAASYLSSTLALLLAGLLIIMKVH